MLLSQKFSIQLSNSALGGLKRKCAVLIPNLFLVALRGARVQATFKPEAASLPGPLHCSHPLTDSRESASVLCGSKNKSWCFVGNILSENISE